jgi:hypothetical protein
LRHRCLHGLADLFGVALRLGGACGKGGAGHDENDRSPNLEAPTAFYAPADSRTTGGLWPHFDALKLLVNNNARLS